MPRCLSSCSIRSRAERGTPLLEISLGALAFQPANAYRYLRALLPSRLGSRRFLPGTLRTVGLSFVAVFHAVIVIAVGNRAQRFVVQARHPRRFLQLFRE